MKCLCCKKDIEKHANRKYCSACSVYTIGMRAKVGGLKYQIRKLRKELYGIADGRQRLRYSHKTSRRKDD